MMKMLEGGSGIESMPMLLRMPSAPNHKTITRPTPFSAPTRLAQFLSRTRYFSDRFYGLHYAVTGLGDIGFAKYERRPRTQAQTDPQKL